MRKGRFQAENVRFDAGVDLAGEGRERRQEGGGKRSIFV